MLKPVRARRRLKFSRRAVDEQLKLAAPNRIDVYIDKIGNVHLEAAFLSSNERRTCRALRDRRQLHGLEPVSGPLAHEFEHTGDALIDVVRGGNLGRW